eukprot:3259187-Pleurochrysis_carterae.AAC.1
MAKGNGDAPRRAVKQLMRGRVRVAQLEQRYGCKRGGGALDNRRRVRDGADVEWNARRRHALWNAKWIQRRY